MSGRPQLTMGPVEWLLLVALSLLWGGSFLFVELALAEFGLFTIVLARVGLAALALNLAVLASGRRMPGSRAAWGRFLAMGTLNNLVPFCLIVWAQTRITGGLASILNATTPLFTVLLAHWLTRDEPMTPRRLAGTGLGVAGVAVLLGGDLLAGLGDDLPAQLAVLAAALSYAFAGLYGRRFRAQPPTVTAAGQVSAATVLLLPLALAYDQPWAYQSGMLAPPGAAAWGALAGLALLSTVLAYVVYFRLLATAGAVNLLLVTLLIPVSAVLLGAAVLGERLELRQGAGMALIGLGLAVIDGRLAARLCRRQPSGPRRSA